MHCDTLIEPACFLLSPVARSVTSAVTGDVLSGLAAAIRGGVRWIAQNTAAWRVQNSSPNLAAEPAITRIQAWLLPVTAAVAVGGVIGAGARMAITRRASSLLDVTGGLLTIAAVAALGVIIPAVLLKAGDAWSDWILQVSAGGHFAQRLSAALVLGGGVAQAVVVIAGILAIIMSLVQAVLMLFRQAALVILAGVLPLAAAGSIAPLTRAWIRKVSSWMLALICYKPAAAAVYAAAFTMIGSGRSARTALTGFVVLLLSVVMLPALMKFFTWTTGSISGAGGGGQLLGAFAVGAVEVGSMRFSGGGSGSAAQDQAAYLSTRLGSPPDSGSPPEPAGSSGPPPGPSGAASAGAASSTGSASSAAPATGTSDSTPAGSAPDGAADTTAAAPTGAAPAGSAGTAAGTGGAAAGSGGAAAGSGGAVAGSAGAAAGAAAAAGPAGAMAAAGIQAAAAAARLATGAMEPEDTP